MKNPKRSRGRGDEAGAEIAEAIHISQDNMLKLAADNHKFLAEQIQLDRETSKEVMKSMEQANTTALLSLTDAIKSLRG